MAEYVRPTLEQILSGLVTWGQTQCTRIKNWTVGGVFHSLMGVFAAGLDALYEVVDTALSLAFYDSSAGAFLDRIATLHNRPRRAAREAEGRVVFGRLTTGGAVSIAAGVIVATQVQADGQDRRFVVAETTTLAAGELEVEVPVIAQAAGSRYNVSAGAIDTLVTAVTGIDYVNNEQTGTDYWLDVEGTDIETDAELQARLPLAWSELSYAAPHEKYKSLALSVTGVYAAAVDPNAPRGDGTVNVYLWGTGGAPTAALIAEVQDLIDTIKPELADVLVLSATPVTVDMDMTVTKSLAGGEPASIAVGVEAAVNELFLPSDNALAFQIGEAFKRASVAAASMQVAYVANVNMIAPAADVAMGAGEIAQPGTITVNVVGA